MIKVNNDYMNIVESYTQVLGALEEHIDISSGDQKVTLEEVFFDDLLEFLLYLSCCDGYLSNEEAEFIEKYIGFYLTPSQMFQRIQKEDIYSEEYEERIPQTFQMFVDVQNALKERGSDADNTLLDTYLAIFKHLGKEIIEIDGDMQPTEAYGLTAYINKLENYMNDNLTDYYPVPNKEYEHKARISGGMIAPAKKRK